MNHEEGYFYTLQFYFTTINNYTMLVIIEERNSTEDEPNLCEIVYSNHISRRKVPKLSIAILRKTRYFDTFDDPSAKHIRKPMCCTDVHGCTNSISTFAIVTEGGEVADEEEKQAIIQSLK